MSVENINQAIYSILLVDDEVNITSSLKRLLRKSNYNIFIASSGEDGLQVLKKNKINLIVSDMRMPNMDGAEFLTKAKNIDEKIIRIMLTGYSDMSSTVSAINDAEIFRYVSKPWNDEDFKLTIKKGLELYSLEADRQRLQILSDKQNKELTILNRSLESKVAHRTTKLKSMMEELQESNDNIKSNYLYIIKTLSALTDMRGGYLVGHSKRVAERSRKLATLINLSEAETQDIFFGALLHDIGKIGLSDETIFKPESTLTKAELERKRKHSVWGEGLLLGMKKFQNVASIIRHHHERYDGSGYPDKLSGKEIPLGARILAIVNDFDSLREGALFQKKYSLEEAKTYLNIHRKTYYDSILVDKFLTQFNKDKPVDEASSKSRKIFYTYRLKPGMVLARDLLTKDRVILLAKGHVLDRDVIERLVHHEKTLKEIFSVHIQIHLVKQ